MALSKNSSAAEVRAWLDENRTKSSEEEYADYSVSLQFLNAAIKGVENENLTDYTYKLGLALAAAVVAKDMNMVRLNPGYYENEAELLKNGETYLNMLAQNLATQSRVMKHVDETKLFDISETPGKF